MLQSKEFRELAEARGRACVSIYMPTHRRGRDVREDPIRLGNLLTEAQQHATAVGLDSRTIERTLAPMRPLRDDTEFLRHQADGLALFAADGALQRQRLAYSVDELVVVGPRYCVRPLLPGIDSGRHCFVLALSQNRVRLLVCAQDSVREMDLHDIPQSMADALGYDWEQRTLQFHTRGPSTSAGRQDAMFHGHGGSEETKEELRKFLHVVDTGVSALLRNRDAPLVLATVGYVASMYRQLSDHPRLMQSAIEGNPDELSPEHLRQRALEIAAPHLSRKLAEQLARLESMRHTPLAASDPQAVLTAARDARVDVMFVAADTALWGRFDADQGTVDVKERREVGDDDLLDLAVVSGLASGARVFGLQRHEMPDGVPLAAILRFA